jgi:hypothetical protein
LDAIYDTIRYNSIPVVKKLFARLVGDEEASVDPKPVAPPEIAKELEVNKSPPLAENRGATAHRAPMG